MFSESFYPEKTDYLNIYTYLSLLNEKDIVGVNTTGNIYYKYLKESY